MGEDYMPMENVAIKFINKEITPLGVFALFMKIFETYHFISVMVVLVVLSLSSFAKAQTSFDPEEGCLNVVDVSYSQGIGEYGDGGISANYLHEKFINDCFSIGAGIGYSYHQKYKFSALPIYVSTHYFFLDRKFSPFCFQINGW